jgi:signal transduction histidine kinase
VASPDDRLRRYAAIGLIGRVFTHEFNNVLAGILGSAQLLAMQADDPKRAGRLATIVQSAQRGMALTHAFAAAASACDGAAAELHAVILELSREGALAPAADGALAAAEARVRMDPHVLALVVAALASSVADPGQASARTRNPRQDGAERWLELALAGTRPPTARALALFEEPTRVGAELEALPLAAASAAVRMARGRIMMADGPTLTLLLPVA